MSLKERLLKKQVLYNKDKAESLALWIRNNEQDLRDILEHDIPVRRIQVEAMADLGSQYPNEVNFESALYFSLLQLEAIRGNHEKFINLPVIDTVEDLEKIEKQKEKHMEIEPYRVGSKKYYYAKFILDSKECELVKLSASKKGMQEHLYKKRDKSFDAYGNPVALDILDIRFATKEELEKMGIINAGENK